MAYEMKDWITGEVITEEGLDHMEHGIYNNSLAIEANAAEIEEVKKTITGHRYGVSGIGQSASALTRIWDAVGMTAQVGTDGDNSAVVNDFDEIKPFNRRKCVGAWHLEGGKAVFRPQAYYGDEDYAEDGSKGDYVAVECPIAYYYRKDDILAISDEQLEGFEPFDIFCRNHNPQDTIPYVYLPAYALAVNEEGHAVCLPGYDNVQGNYKDVVDACRTYKNGELGNLAIAQPMAVNFYEWAMFTVEFAQQNSQNVMYGCASLRSDGNDRATFPNTTHVLTSNYQAGRVVGEYIALLPESVSDVHASTYQATHKVIAVVRCDENGTQSSVGDHQLLTVEDLGKAYFEYDTTGATQYKIAGRPYRTGACNDVSTPSGSPVSNHDGYHPMKYRWRENVFGNQYHTIADLFAKRVGTSDDDYSLEWYYLTDPSAYAPASASKPDATDLETAAFTKLDFTTPHQNYHNGYIKSKVYSELFPDVWTAGDTTGSASTYYADYAYLVNSHVVRSVRLGGLWAAGANDGFSYLSAYAAPSNAAAHYGGDLCFIQG